MKIEDTPVKVFRRRAFCETCGDELIGTGHGVTQWKTCWEHKCSCDTPIFLPGVCYPTIQYEDTDEVS